MVGVEIDFVVKDSLKALALYESIFPIERVEVTELPQGQNEAVFTLYGTRMHMLDENPDFGMTAPKPDDPKPVWFNVLVPDIQETYGKALAAGCTEIQPVTEVPTHGASNAMFSDPFGYIWLVHQMHKIVPFEERVKAMTEDK